MPLLMMPLNALATDEINPDPFAALMTNASLIEANAFSQVRGRLAVNQAAGEDNTQTNSHAIGALASIHFNQQNSHLDTPTNSVDISQIGNASFGNAEGLLSINQVSGQHNLQANLGVIGMDLSSQALSDADMLTINTAAKLPQAASASSTYTTEIASDSLLQVRGLVQINQISGSNNAAVNQFSLQFVVGGN
ncbi:MAG: hypothetical protein ACRCT7_18645 [Shewanella sp.]